MGAVGGGMLLGGGQKRTHTHAYAHKFCGGAAVRWCVWGNYKTHTNANALLTFHNNFHSFHREKLTLSPRRPIIDISFLALQMALLLVVVGATYICCSCWLVFAIFSVALLSQHTHAHEIQGSHGIFLNSALNIALVSNWKMFAIGLVS